MENYIKRLNAERAKLNDKIVRIELFLNSGEGDFMDDYLLEQQLKAMSEYRDALSSRLIYANSKAQIEKERIKENQIDPEDNPETMLEINPSAEETALMEIEKIIKSLEAGEPFKVGCGDSIYLDNNDLDDIVRSGLVYVLGVYTKELKYRIKDIR